MSGRTPRLTTGFLTGALWAASVCLGASPTAGKMSGSIVGVVTDPTGVPQMGASISLFNRYDRLVQRMMTGVNGAFGFALLNPDVYSIRVNLATFLPAVKRNILVQPGMQSMLNVSMASVFSSIELVYAAPGERSVMSDEWKWVLRSASATRPVFRWMPDLGGTGRNTSSSTASMFSDTRGLVRVSAGDQGQSSLLGSEADLGTAFAFATSVYGSNQVHFSGNVGYSANTGMPTAGFQTSFKRDLPGGASPEVRLTMRQLSVPGRTFLGGESGAPPVRTLSAAMFDRKQLTDGMELEYGFSMDSVTFLDRLNYFSPYARLTYDAGDEGLVQMAYSSGTPPAELFSSAGANSQLHDDLVALALIPRVSLREGAAQVQRVQTFEFGYRKTVGSRTYGVAAYQDSVRNAALTMTGPEGLAASPDLLPDMFSESWIFNAGNYRSAGYLASITQGLGEHFDATLAYGSGGALTADQPLEESGSPDQLRRLIRTSRRQSLTARLSGAFPATGTQFATSYQWSNIRALTPSHVYLTQRVGEGLGFNVQIRQPLPYCSGLPGRLELTADLRNLLAQGYVPLMAGGRRMFLMNTPRSVRGGLSFIF